MIDEHSLLQQLQEQGETNLELLFRVSASGDYQLVYSSGAASGAFGLPKIEFGKAPLPWSGLPPDLSQYLGNIFNAVGSYGDRALPIYEQEQPVRASYSVKIVGREMGKGSTRVCWYLLSFNDVGSWLSLQEEVMNARRMESIGAMAGGVAHDFNNLIMAIQGQAEYLFHKYEKIEEVRSTSEQILKACTHGTALTRSLLGYARKQSLVMENLNLVQLVQDVCELCQRTFGPKYTIKLQPPLDNAGLSIVIHGCYSALSHCLMNVLTNARDAMAEGGKIQLVCREMPGYVILTVVDGGIGMSPDLVKKVFEPFFTTKPKGAGTGLGLAMVNGIMEQHSGKVEIESKVGQGTRFSFFWPKSLDDKIPPAQEDVVDNTLSAVPFEREEEINRTAWIIEDDDSVIRSVGRLLKLQDFEVESFNNASKVLEKLSKNPRELPAVIMVDYTMPGMDGMEFIQQAHELIPDIWTQKARIILMSGYPPEHFSKAIRDLKGVPVYLLQKPFSAQSLEGVLTTTLSRYHRKITSRFDVQPQVARR